MTSLAKPAVGQTVTDPQFGTTIRRITAVNPAEGDQAVIKPMYSVMPAWNADESKLILYHVGKGQELYDGKTYAFIRDLNITPTDIEQILWDPVDPDVFYYPSNYNALPILKMYRVSTDTSTDVADFRTAPTNCPVDWGNLLSLGSDPQYMSWGSPSKIIGLQCGNKKIVYDITHHTVLGVKSFTSTNAPIVAPSGTLVYIDGGVYDTGLNLLRSLNIANPDEHSSLGLNASGDTHNAVSFDDAVNGNLLTRSLSTGAVKVIIGPSAGYPGYPRTGTHISGNATKVSGWVAESIVGDTSGKGLLDQEILLANTNTGAVCQVAHHRSFAGDGNWGYWAEPHANLSPSGTRIVFASDWGNGTTVDTYVVELPSYHP